MLGCGGLVLTLTLTLTLTLALTLTLTLTLTRTLTLSGLRVASLTPASTASSPTACSCIHAG